MKVKEFETLPKEEQEKILLEVVNRLVEIIQPLLNKLYEFINELVINIDLFFIADGGAREDIINIINNKLEQEEYVYEYRKINNHLITEQVDAFFIKNKKDSSKLIRLHCELLNKGEII